MQVFSQLQKMGKSLMLPVSAANHRDFWIGGGFLASADKGGMQLGAVSRLFFEILQNAGDPIFGSLALLLQLGSLSALPKRRRCRSRSCYWLCCSQRNHWNHGKIPWC